MTSTLTHAGRLAYRGGDGLYLNITNRCSNACTFCLREWTDGVYGEVLVLAREPELDDILRELELELVESPAAEVVFCGFGEPTMRLDLAIALIEWLRLRHIRARLDTNGHGQLLNPGVDVPAALAAAGLAATSVSLNAADPARYDEICRPFFSGAHRAVLSFAEECVRQSIETTLSAVDQPGADLAGCRGIADRMGVKFRARSLAAPRERPKEGAPR